MDSAFNDKSSDFNQSHLVPLIKLIFKMHCSDKANLIGVHNQQLKEILEIAGIKHLDLGPFLNYAADKIHFKQSLETISACEMHELYFVGMRCGKAKACALQEWLKMKKGVNSLKELFKV